MRQRKLYIFLILIRKTHVHDESFHIIRVIWPYPLCLIVYNEKCIYISREELSLAFWVIRFLLMEKGFEEINIFQKSDLEEKREHI